MARLRARLCPVFGHWITILGEDRTPGDVEGRIRWRCPNCGREARVKSTALERARARQSRAVALALGLGLFAVIALGEAVLNAPG